ncbi:MAG TPA: acyl-CoA thioesterase [Myxococcaceae bacterium]|nr:acyl-CoA thioesterase [Myxococcaceae bacterium]
MPELPAKSPGESAVTMTQMILPGDANPLNAAFGGKVMEWIDVCGGVAAQRHCRRVVVTASMDDLHFHVPIGIGWIVTLCARVLAAFHTSMEVGVMVWAENPLTGERHLATSALLTFVALDEKRNKVPVPPLVLNTPEEHAAFEEAQARRRERLARKQDSTSWQRVMGAS